MPLRIARLGRWCCACSVSYEFEGIYVESFGALTVLEERQELANRLIRLRNLQPAQRFSPKCCASEIVEKYMGPALCSL